MTKKINLSLDLAEWEHLVTTLEGCHEELEVLMTDVSWYSTELTERIETCLMILENQREGE